MTTDWFQYGLGGVLSLYVVQKAFALLEKKFSKNGNGNGNATGNKPVEFWQQEIREAVGDVMRGSLGVVLENQTEILKGLQSEQKSTAIMLQRLVWLSESRPKS